MRECAREKRGLMTDVTQATPTRALFCSSAFYAGYGFNDESKRTCDGLVNYETEDRSLFCVFLKLVESW